MNDQLCKQGIVEVRYFASDVKTRIDPYAGSLWLNILQESACAGQKPSSRVFGVDATLEGVSALGEVRLLERESFSRCDTYLPMERSRPVTNSVTGCSTCNRVFIS